MSSDSTRLPPAVFLMGPTAAGKTGVAVALQERYPCELVSVDSAQVYRGLDIGSGKPDAATLKRSPHHLIDIRDPADAYSAADFRSDALKVMKAISARGKVPVLVGGTMLYFKALRDGLADLPAADPATRQRLLERAHREGWEALHEELQKIDPEAALRIRPTDPQRLQRALEVYALTGRPISELQRQTGTPLPFALTQIALMPPQRALLHARIETRLRQMLREGFVEEVQTLKARGDLDPTLPAIRSVGYRQIWDYLDGVYDYDVMFGKALAATRQLAKRQLTWLRSWPGLLVFDSEAPDVVERVLNSLPAIPT